MFDGCCVWDGVVVIFDEVFVDFICVLCFEYVCLVVVIVMCSFIFSLGGLLKSCGLF